MPVQGFWATVAQAVIIAVTGKLQDKDCVTRSEMKKKPANKEAGHGT